MTILVFIEAHLFRALSAISLRFIILSPLYAPSAVINNEHFESLILDANASRLEMGTKFGIEGHKTLYSFWKDDLTKFLKTELIDSEIVVNLASKEYSDAINFNLLESNVITPIFKDFKNGKYKIISFYAKKARGLMSKYLIENKSNSLNDILAFNTSGYSFSESETFDSNQPVFIR